MCKIIELSYLEEPKPFTAKEQQAIDDLKILCDQHSHIHFQTDNYFLTKFLRCHNWNAENAFTAILHFYDLKVRNLFDCNYSILIVKCVFNKKSFQSVA